jgi:hypothetical protein
MYEVIRRRSGEAEVPQLPPTRMTPLLYGAKPKVSHKASLLIGRLPSNVVMTAVVELDRPMTIKELKKIGDPTSIDVLLSPLRPPPGVAPRTDTWKSKPLYWPSGLPCAERDRPTCADDDQVSQFQAWVARLRDEDSKSLEEFGLDLSQMRKAAAEGLVYGYIVEGQPEVVRLDATGPEVKAAYIADITPVTDEDQIVEPLPRKY